MPPEDDDPARSRALLDIAKTVLIRATAYAQALDKGLPDAVVERCEHQLVHAMRPVGDRWLARRQARRAPAERPPLRFGEMVIAERDGQRALVVVAELDGWVGLLVEGRGAIDEVRLRDDPRGPLLWRRASEPAPSGDAPEAA